MQVFVGDTLNETVGVLLYDLNIILTGLEERDFSGGRIRITVSLTYNGIYTYRRVMLFVHYQSQFRN